MGFFFEIIGVSALTALFLALWMWAVYQAKNPVPPRPQREPRTPESKRERDKEAA